MATNSSFRTLTLSNIEGIAEEKNYLKSNFENASTAGWNKFTTTLTSGVPTGSLTVGTAASITFFDAYAVNPLTGKLSLRVNSGNTGWTAGQGIISDVITIDRQDQGKVLNITFDYEPTINPSSINFSGVLGQQTFAIYVYDVTASAWVQPAGFLSMTGNGISTARATFQTAMVAGQQYRVAIVCLQTTPSISVGLVFDNFQMTRSNYIYGTPVTDWQSYTPTFQGFGTPTSVQFQWRRVGDNVEIRGKFASGTSTAVEARVSLPSGLTSSSSKIGSTQPTGGVAVFNSTGAGSFTALMDSSVSYVTFGVQATSFAGLGKLNGNQLTASGTFMAFTASVPVEGWSSSVQTSDSADTRVVDFKVRGLSSSTITSGTPLSWSTVSKNSHGTFNGTNTYTVPVSGDYCFTAFFYGFSAAMNIEVRKNGVIFDPTTFIYADSSARRNIANTFLLQDLVAGDQITLVPVLSATSSIPASDTFSMFRLSGPSAIAASETVAASYYISPASLAVNTSQINYDTKNFDTHNAVTTGASWKFTAPVSGIYRVNTSLYYSAGANTNVNIHKNGTVFATMFYIDNVVYFNSGVILIQLNAGDYIDIRDTSSFTFAGTTVATQRSYINIERIGN
jgi:hypothetical protein